MGPVNSSSSGKQCRLNPSAGDLVRYQSKLSRNRQVFSCQLLGGHDVEQEKTKGTTNGTRKRWQPQRARPGLGTHFYLSLERANGNEPELLLRLRQQHPWLVSFCWASQPSLLTDDGVADTGSTTNRRARLSTPGKGLIGAPSSASSHCASAAAGASNSSCGAEEAPPPAFGFASWSSCSGEWSAMKGGLFLNRQDGSLVLQVRAFGVHSRSVVWEHAAKCRCCALPGRDFW